MDASKGFMPIERQDARVLILGSLPGQKSIAAQQYYAHAQNAFWPIMRELLGVQGDYAQRCTQLKLKRVALWDVLGASVRSGSLDANIRLSSAVVNDFASFVRQHKSLVLIAFNGKKAEQLYQRFVLAADEIPTVGLPSTSPAYASLAFSGKLAAWRAGLGPSLR